MMELGNTQSHGPSSGALKGAPGLVAGKFSLEALRAIERILKVSSDEEEAVLSSIPSVLATCGDLERSLVLLETVQRKYDDFENARERARLLDSQLSRLLNTCLDEVEMSPEVGRVLDLAKDASENVLSNPSEGVGIWEDACARVSPAHKWIFTSNLIYEVLITADSLLNYTEGRLGPNVVRREILFAPEHIEAGITILTNFASIIRARQAHNGTSVRIVQEDLKVTLICESPAGREEVERTLAAYGGILYGAEISGGDFFSPLELASLRQAMEVARMQIDTQGQLIELMQGQAERDSQLHRESGETISKLVDTVQMAFSLHGQCMEQVKVPSIDGPLTVGDLRGIIAVIRRIGIDDIGAELGAIEDRLGDESIEDAAPADSASINRLKRLVSRIRENYPSAALKITAAVAVGTVAQAAGTWLVAMMG